MPIPAQHSIHIYIYIYGWGCRATILSPSLEVFWVKNLARFDVRSSSKVNFVLRLWWFQDSVVFFVLVTPSFASFLLPLLFPQNCLFWGHVPLKRITFWGFSLFPPPPFWGVILECTLGRGVFQCFCFRGVFAQNHCFWRGRPNGEKKWRRRTRSGGIIFKWLRKKKIEHQQKNTTRQWRRNCRRRRTRQTRRRKTNRKNENKTDKKGKRRKKELEE